MQTDRKTEERIFKAVIQLTTAAEREAYILEACGDNRELLTGVQTLLKYHDTDSFLDAPIFEPDMILDDSPIAEGPGAVIGRYKLLERIGEGGMAVVYMAEQAEPIRRKVALKIIKLGMDTRSVIARFEAERQALAMMDHPNIAKVLDAGATETGRPYFVMELVTGVSITDYCDKNNLSTKGRLALFIQVCNAVQHAHQKGIIHRDIKPTNVMVTQHEGTPVPKVIDFGIAKATNQRLTEKTLFTRYAHIIGTPAYMSPEQADMSDLDVDTRSDIYSLGVLLYELLTGATPFSEEELRKAGYIEMQRVIREQEPPKPSTKLSTLGETLTDIARYRASTPDLLTKAIRGDLDWIVMKTLEKERNRRYETANLLALDVRHHLDNEPVLARGPATTYRFRKYLRRHRSQTIAALTVLVAAIGLAVILSQWNEDRLQLTEAEEFKQRGILSQAREQYARADREAALETLKPILHRKHIGPEAQLLQAGILVDNRRSDEAVAVLESLLNERPEIAGAAHSLLARILWENESPNAEKLKEIEQHHRKAETLLPETAEAYFLRAMTAVTVKEQLASLDKALLLDPGHYESRRLRAFTYYASRKYEGMKDDALVMAVSRLRDPLGHSLRAIALHKLGKYEEAIAEYNSAIARTLKEDSRYIDLSTQRCETLLRMGDYERVVADAREYLKLSPDYPVFQYHTFCALVGLGDYDKAAALFRQIISPDHEARRKFGDWCMKYVFDTLETGRSWHPADREPVGSAFLPMVEAQETYHNLSARAHRLTTDGFSARWSPDGKKLAFSAGVHGYSGVAVFDPATKDTELLIVPGKDPKWSPDAKYIAFVRDCQLLRLEELATAERKDQHRMIADEEVWLMNSDGTRPRRLARGSWPSWGSDSRHIYYQARAEKMLYSLALEGQDAEPKQIGKCSDSLSSVSPDGGHVAYFKDGSLRIMELTSQTAVAAQPMPFPMWGGAAWSPTGREVCLGGSNPQEEKTGLWIYDLCSKDFLSVLDGRIKSACWSADGTKLAFALAPPFYEIWAADLDPNVPTVEALGPGQTLDEHIREMLAFYTRRIETDPQDAYAYSGRAHYHDCLHDREEATADMKRWSAILSGGRSSDFKVAAPRKVRRVINSPFGYQFVFSAERPVNEIPVLNVAFGQKGRCIMKSFRMPVLSIHGVAMSLLGLCLSSGLDSSSVHADITFGEPANLKSIMPVLDAAREFPESPDCFSYDGLEMYTSSDRSDGYGDDDLWVLNRNSTDDDWGQFENLGPLVNTAKSEMCASISADGLTLCFSSNRDDPTGDIYMTTRPTRQAPWAPAVNLGPKVNHPTATDIRPWISADGLELYFASWRSGGYGGCDIYVTIRATTSDPWGQAANLGPVVNSAYIEFAPSLSQDSLVMLFSEQWASIASGTSPRPGGYGACDMWMTKRASLSDPWETPVNLGPPVNSSKHEVVPRISPDGSTLYFTTNSGGIWENWQAPIEPLADFDGDGDVDCTEICIMTEFWGTSDSLCDIAPPPFGDGIVDVQDLLLLAEHLTTVVDPNSAVTPEPLTYADAAFTFGEPVNVKTVIPAIDANYDQIDCFSPDGLEMYITSWRPYGSANGDLYVLRRTSKDEEWGPPENLGPVVNGPADDSYSSISDDGLALYFGSNRSGGHGGWDIWVTERATVNDLWGMPRNLGSEINSSRNDGGPWISGNGLELYFASVRSGGYGRADIYVATRTTADDPWGEAVNLGSVVNSPFDDQGVCLSPDGLLLLFNEDPSETAQRPGGYGGGDMWMTRRASLSAAWQAPVNLGPAVNSSMIDCVPRISPDGSTLYFAKSKGMGTGTWEYWQASILPVVDLSGDGNVDCTDICIMTEFWGTTDSLCDIAPPPFGDGIVDVQDLILLSEYLTSAVGDPNTVIDPTL